MECVEKERRAIITTICPYKSEAIYPGTLVTIEQHRPSVVIARDRTGYRWVLKPEWVMYKDEHEDQ